MYTKIYKNAFQTVGGSEWQHDIGIRSLLWFVIRIKSFHVNASVAAEMLGRDAVGSTRAGKAQHRSEGQRPGRAGTLGIGP